MTKLLTTVRTYDHTTEGHQDLIFDFDDDTHFSCCIRKNDTNQTIANKLLFLAHIIERGLVAEASMTRGVDLQKREVIGYKGLLSSIEDAIKATKQ